MPNRGAVSQTITSQGGSYTIPAGYHNGSGKVTASFSNLSAGNIKTGVNIGGVTGTFTSDATAVAGNILSGKTAYVNGNKVTGTMTNRGTVNQTITTQGGSYTIPAGYHSGSGKVTANFTNLSAGNIKAGVNVGGVVGTYTGDYSQVTAGDNYVLYDKGKGISCSGAQKEKWAMVFHGISGTIRFSFTGITSKTGYVRTYYIKINDDVVKGPLTKNTGSSDDYTWTYDLNINFGDRLSLWGGTTGGQCSISSVKIKVTNPPPYYQD